MLPCTHGCLNSLILFTPAPSVPLSQPKPLDWPSYRRCIETLPTPAAVTSLFLGLSSTMAPAAPRVLVRALSMRLSVDATPVLGCERKTTIASQAACSANGPCPNPSTTIARKTPSVSRTSHPSPHNFSCSTATLTPPVSKASAASLLPEGYSRAQATVPPPGWENLETVRQALDRSKTATRCAASGEPVTKTLSKI